MDQEKGLEEALETDRERDEVSVLEDQEMDPGKGF